MELHLIPALLLFAFVTSITPGPNNLMLLSAGATFGVGRTIPHMLGVCFGITPLITACALGLGALLHAFPTAHAALRWGGAAYLVFLALQVARSKPPEMDNTTARSKPLSFWGAAAFQWVNPKAWSMALGACSSFLPEDPGLGAALAMCALFSVVNLPCIAAWVLFGANLRRFLSSDLRLRLFNYLLAVLVLTGVPAILGERTPTNKERASLVAMRVR